MEQHYCMKCPAAECRRRWTGSRRLRCNVTGKQTGPLTPCFATAVELDEFIRPLANERDRKGGE
jgi:hypothetical protein